MSIKRIPALAALCFCVSLALPGVTVAQTGEPGSSGGVDDFGMEDHSATCNPDANMQTLSEPDFNGDGRVNVGDLRAVIRAVRAYRREGQSEYLAFYDINNDSVLNAQDIWNTARRMGRRSSTLDQQVAALFNNVIKYRDISLAVQDGFFPFTQEYKNHGIHLMKFPQFDENGMPIPSTNVLDQEFDYARPEGLNYDRYGNLVGVFYYVGPDLLRLMGLSHPDPEVQADAAAHFQAWMSGDWDNPAIGDYAPGHHGKPHGFANGPGDKMEDHWHFHQGICQRNIWSMFGAAPALFSDGISFDDVSVLGELLDTRQCDLFESCMQYNPIPAGPGGSIIPDSFYMPRFFMLHVWLFNQNNRCGMFWGSHEDVSHNDVTLEEREEIPSETASFVIQPDRDVETIIVDGVEEDNRNYRKLCLAPEIIGLGGLTYEELESLIDDPTSVEIVGYDGEIITADDVQATIVCPPSVQGAQDPRCDKHPRD